MEGDDDRLRLGLDFGISIHALRVEGDLRLLLQAHRLRISIHALRVEGDDRVAVIVNDVSISIHALRVEGDRLQAWRYVV